MSNTVGKAPEDVDVPDVHVLPRLSGLFGIKGDALDGWLIGISRGDTRPAGRESIGVDDQIQADSARLLRELMDREIFDPNARMEQRRLMAGDNEQFARRTRNCLPWYVAQ